MQRIWPGRLGWDEVPFHFVKLCDDKTMAAKGCRKLMRTELRLSYIGPLHDSSTMDQHGPFRFLTREQFELLSQVDKIVYIDGATAELRRRRDEVRALIRRTIQVGGPREDVDPQAPLAR